jgi:hypothetical protein
MPPEGRRELDVPQALQRFKASEQRTVDALLDLRHAWKQWEADPTEANRQDAVTAAHEASKATMAYLALGEEVMATAGIETPEWVSNLSSSLA